MTTDRSRDPGAEARMAALDSYAILDTPAEEGFDDLVALAGQCCDAPIALISLVTQDRQWFKARIGLDERETPIGDSICAYALGEPDLLVIPDLAGDPRAKGNALVERPGGVRFYAGAPLQTASGAVLGTLCVLDVEPRPTGLTGRQADALRRLARQVIAQLELRRLLAVRDGRIEADRVANERLAQNGRLLSVREELWRALFEKLSEGFVVGELVRDEGGRVVDWTYRYLNPAWANLIGLPRREVIGRRVGEVLPGLERSWIEGPATVVQTGAPHTFVRPIETPDREHRQYDAHAFHLEGDRFAMLLVEITERVRTGRRQAALLTLGDRLRESGDIADMIRIASRIVGETLEAKRAGFGQVDPGIGAIAMEAEWTAPDVAGIAGTRHFGGLGEILNGKPVVIGDVRTDPHMVGDPAAMLSPGMISLVGMPVRERGGAIAALVVQDGKARHWTEDELGFLRNVADRLEVSIARLRGEEQQRMLNQELSHRLKNTLAMVQAIATQTLKPVAERDAVASFEQRLGALAAAHDVLLSRNWEAADLATVAQGVLGVLDGRGRFRLDGPPVELGTRAAMSTSLLLHELGTNAIKYGALSVEQGRVDLRWSIGDDELVTIKWIETGGPPATTPGRRGFGSRLIGMGLVGTGGVDVRYDSTGFSATICAPLPELQQA